MVPMNKKVEDILNEMYIDRQDGMLFDYHPDTVTHKFKKYVKRSKIEKDIHLHTCVILLPHILSCRE